MLRIIQSKWLLLLLVVGGFFALSIDGNRLLKISQSMENFAQTYRIINYQYVDETDPNKLMRTAIDSMLGHLDPYTNYFSEAQMVRVKMGAKGGWDGIGVELREINGKAVVVEVVENTPAEKNKIQVGDILTEIDGTTIDDQPIESVSQTLQGKAGTKVNVKFIRTATEETLDLELERAKVIKKNVPYYGMLDERTGYIVLTTFSQSAGANVEAALKALQDEHEPTQVILDLRNNGGGFLIEAVNICNLFVPKGNEIVYTRNKIEKWDRSFKTINNVVDRTIPLVVLMNGSSASASEIVAGALQDLDRAVLAGRNSFGKGLVQNTKDVGYSSKVKLTTAKYYIPSGRCVQALEYKNGKPVSIADSLRKEFETKSGRKVYDGKGLEPDFKIEAVKVPLVVKAAKAKNLFFDYATQYYNKHDSIVAAKEFEITETDYQAFVKKATPIWADYKTDTEKMLDELEKQSKKEGTLQELGAEIKAARSAIDQDKKTAFVQYKKEIKEAIEQEIVGRYYYMTGQVENRLARDKDVLEVLKLLSDKDKFNQLLTPSK